MGQFLAGYLTEVMPILIANVSIGGTLTYEDVTNIDSVGVITASAFSIADSIVHTGDTDENKIPAPDTFVMETAISERLRITSTGQLNLGNMQFTWQIRTRI